MRFILEGHARKVIQVTMTEFPLATRKPAYCKSLTEKEPDFLAVHFISVLDLMPPFPF